MRSRFEDLLRFARARSEFYRAHCRGLPARPAPEEVPLTDPSAYWQHAERLQGWPVLTGPVHDGHVFKTGGSTSEGRLSVFTRLEWQAFVRAFGRGVAAQLRPGDRVANLFFAGDLYTSLLFIHGALAQAPLPLVEYPFSCHVEPGRLAAAIACHDINVLAGVPSQLAALAQHLLQAGRHLAAVQKLLYGGESVSPAQAALLHQAFPRARLGSLGCASVDAGLIGQADPDCAAGEHRVFDGDSAVQIVDEEHHAPIDTPGRPGLLVVTNLQRRLMPVIRYPTGDLACWREGPAPRRRFALLGRSGQGWRVRVGTLTLFPEAVAPVLARRPDAPAWQWVILREGLEDVLQLHVACPERTDLAQLRREVLAEMPALAAQGPTAPPRLVVCAARPTELHTHPRSGKLLRVVDLRAGGRRVEPPNPCAPQRI